MEEISNEILTKAARGDIRSFEIIYRTASGFVHNVAFRVVHNAQDAEEITQEVFINIYRKLKSFRGQSSQDVDLQDSRQLRDQSLEKDLQGKREARRIRRIRGGPGHSQ